jgi:hypothetical protein
MSRSKYVSVGDTGGLILDGKYDDFATNAQLESKLGGIENKLVALEQKLTDGSQKVQLSGTFVRLSTEPKPSGSEGDTLLLYDTKQVFIHDGTDWREW